MGPLLKAGRGTGELAVQPRDRLRGGQASGDGGRGTPPGSSNQQPSPTWDEGQNGVRERKGISAVFRLLV